MRRLATAFALALLMTALIPAAAGATPPPATNMNGGEIVFTCEDGTQVTVWVNFVGSDRGGENPAIVVAGSDARVFKLVSYSVEIEPGIEYFTRFPAPPSTELVTCTHPLILDDGTPVTVTLTGVFLP